SYNITLNRHNQDHTTSNFAHLFFKFLRSFGIYILNGRSSTNSGNFTFHGHQGHSSIDYVLASYALNNSIIKFDILHCDSSDHCFIAITLDTGQPTSCSEKYIKLSSLQVLVKNFCKDHIYYNDTDPSKVLEYLNTAISNSLSNKHNKVIKKQGFF